MHLSEIDFSPFAKSEIFSFEGYVVFLRKDNIFHLQFEDDFHGTLAVAKNIVKVMRQISHGNKYPVLAIYGKYNTFEQGVREYIASDVVSEIAAADAFVVNSLALKLMGNVYLKVNKPNRPSKIFNNVNEALIWLKQFCPQNNF